MEKDLDYMLWLRGEGNIGEGCINSLLWGIKGLQLLRINVMITLLNISVDTFHGFGFLDIWLWSLLKHGKSWNF